MNPKSAFVIVSVLSACGFAPYVFADVLGSARTRQRGYFQGPFIDRLVREHLSGRRDHTLRLWQLLVFELWHRHFADRPAISAAPVVRRTS